MLGFSVMTKCILVDGSQSLGGTTPAAFYTSNFVYLEMVFLETGTKIRKRLLCEIRLR